MLDREEPTRLHHAPVSCDISYRFPDSEQFFIGECIDISGAGLIFRGEHLLQNGMALEIAVATKNMFTTPLRSYVEVIRSKEVEPNIYEVVAEIKGIREY